MLKDIIGYFSYDMVWYALIVALLIALCAALFGIILVLKRFSFIGDGLSHVAFGAMALATVLSVSNSMLIVMPVTVAAAVLLLRAGKGTRLKGDSAVAVISVGALALGYLAMSIFKSSANVAGDVCSTLFGSASILYLSMSDVILCIILSVIVIALFLCFYNKIFALTFDEDFAKASGVRVSLYNLLVAVITAVIIVMAMRLVGSLLISALIIFPALSAMRIFKSFRGVVIFSCILSLLCASSGFIASLAFNTPIGPTIVTADILAFALCFALGKIMRR